MKNKKLHTISELVLQFESIRGYFTWDSKLSYYLRKVPRNDYIQTVTEKVTTIGSPSLWQNGEQQVLAKHIMSLKIDDRLKKGDLSLINDLGNIKVGFSDYNLLNFFSRYCCVHQPAHYVIYSNSTLKILRSYYSDFDAMGDKCYIDYWKRANLVLNDLHITLPNYFCVDKFFWLYESELISVLEETQKQSAFSATS